MSNEGHSALVEKAVAEYPTLGYSILPGFFTEEDLAPALSTLDKTLSPPDAYSNGSAEFQQAHRKSYRAGLADWPYPSTELSLLGVHPKLIELSETLLGSPDIRMYNGHAWVKYAGASYDQDHHRDYRGHTPVIASQDPEFKHVQYFVLLSDVDEGNGPPMFVDKRLSTDVPMHPHLAPREAHPEFYEAEIPGVGPRGTIIAFDIDTFHRATDLKRDGASRYMLLTFFRRAEANWVAGPGRGILTEDQEWIDFVESASRRQLDMLGFPGEDHRYWTKEIKQAYIGRYPGADRSWLGIE
jgi:hypothetical protein